jgi:hypothetical protein
MKDAGEALVDAEDRYWQRMAEREHERERAAEERKDPLRERLRQSLELGRRDLLLQEKAATSEARRQQIRQALAEVERRLSQI